MTDYSPLLHLDVQFNITKNLTIHMYLMVVKLSDEKWCSNAIQVREAKLLALISCEDKV